MISAFIDELLFHMIALFIIYYFFQFILETIDDNLILFRDKKNYLLLEYLNIFR